MKKILALVLALVLALSLCACGAPAVDGTGDEGSVTILGCNILIESGPAGILTDACLYENLVDSGGVRVNSTNINEYLNDEYFDFYVYMLVHVLKMDIHGKQILLVCFL